jgi:hypothetical protein
MKIFISSLILGMEPFRAAAREAVTTLRHEPIMAEDFGASPNSPQIACLTGVRQADLVVSMLGKDYGALQPSGLSATHEEYREAKGQKPVLAFVQSGVDREPKQAEFVSEVQGWESGLFRGSFTDATNLRIAITRDLHDYQLTNASGPIDQEELSRRAEALLKSDRRSRDFGGATLNVALAGAPKQSILRPGEIENPALGQELSQALLFGERRLFDLTLGIQRALEGSALVLIQGRGASRISIDEDGSFVAVQSLREANSMMSEIIQEFVQEQLLKALAYGIWVLDRIDPTQKLGHIGVAVNIANGDHMGWRTQRESEASPNSMSGGLSSGRPQPVHMNRSRASLRLDATHIVEDLTVMLRRQWR